MIIDILQTIIDYANLPSQVYCINIDHNTYDNLYIHALDASKYSNIDQKIISQQKFHKLIKLNCHNNCNIRDLNNIGSLCNTLEILDCSQDMLIHNIASNIYDNIIKQSGIIELKKIKVLRCGNNGGIKNVNCFADTLEELDCSGPHSNIDQRGISKLKVLKDLICKDNSKICDVNYLSETLCKLDCSGNSNIGQSGISELKYVHTLICTDNKLINNANHLKRTLTRLECGGADNMLDQNGISSLNKIITLDCCDNGKINDVNHMATLEVLKCGGLSGINQKGISELKKLINLYCRNNPHIYSVNHIGETLEELDCSGMCRIDQNG